MEAAGEDVVGLAGIEFDFFGLLGHDGRSLQGRRRPGFGLLRCGLLSSIGCITVGQAFDLKLFGDGQEGIEVLLGHIDLAIVDEIQDGRQVTVADPA